MSDAASDRIPLLTPLGFEALAARPSPREGAGVAASLRAVAESGRFLGELAAPPEADPVGESGLLVALPYSGRFHYRWLAVDLGHAATELRSALADAIRRTRSDQGGLLLTDRDDSELPAHVHTAASVTAGDPRLQRPWYLRQLCRFALRAFGATRVLFLDLADAALFPDLVGEHASAVALSRIDPTLPVDGRSAARTGRKPSPVQALRWLRAAAPSGQPSELPTDREGARLAEELVLRTATAFFLPQDARADVPRLRRIAPKAGLLTASATAFASHLAPGALAPAEDERRDDPRAIRVEAHELGRRDPRRAPARALFACMHLLGDLLASTPVIREWRRARPAAHVTMLVPDRAYARIMALCPDVDRLVYVSVDSQQLVFGGSTDLVRTLPMYAEEYDERMVLDIQAVARSPQASRLHMSEGYAHLAGIPISSRRPALDAGLARAHRPALGLTRHYAVLARHTVSGGPVGSKDLRARRWPEKRWAELARSLGRELGLEVVSIGLPQEPLLASAHALDAHHLSILEVAGLLADASLLVTITNGIFHVGQGLRTPTLHLVNDRLGLTWVSSDPEGPHFDLAADLSRLDVRRVVDAARELVEAPRPDAPRRSPERGDAAAPPERTSEIEADTATEVVRFHPS